MENRVSQSQLEELVDHLMANPCLVKGGSVGLRSREVFDREWHEIATRLNAHIGGARKTAQRWKRYWADLKFKTKSRAKRRQEAPGPSVEQLSEIEKKLLTIAGEPIVFDDQQDRVPAFGDSIHEKSQMDSSSSQSTSAMKFQDSASECNDDSVEAIDIPEPTVEVIIPRRNLKRHVPRHYRENSFNRRRPRRDTSPISRGKSRGNMSELSWVVELERRRVEAETKLADAALVAAGAARLQAEASRTHAEAALQNSVVLNKILDILANK